MSGLQLAFSPLEFNFKWSDSRNDRPFYYRENPIVIMYEDKDINRGTVYTIQKQGTIVYTGVIDTKYFAGQLFKNLGIIV